MRETVSVSLTANVEPHPINPRRLEPLIGVERVEALLEAASALRALIGSRRILNINSTANGGGVAEMLATLLGYGRGLGLESNWLVIGGDHEFFTVTKRLHNGLYGGPGDGGDLGERERAIYERTLAANLAAVLEEVETGDIVVLHDPQPAGLIAPLVARGARVIWRCHVGYDDENEWTERAWAFLRRYVEAANAHVFSRESFAPSWIDRARLRAIPPSIDPFTPKNRTLYRQEVQALLSTAGLIAGTVRSRTFVCDTERTSSATGRRPIGSFRSSFKSPGGTG